MMLVLSFIMVVAKLNLFESIYLSLARDWEAGYTLQLAMMSYHYIFSVKLVVKDYLKGNCLVLCSIRDAALSQIIIYFIEFLQTYFRGMNQ